MAWTIGELLAKLLSKFYPYVDFTDDNVFLDLAELNERLKVARPGETFVLDEQTEFYGIGSLWFVTTLQNIEMTCRKNQINFIYCSPMIRTHYHNLVLETFLNRWPEQRCTVKDEGYIPFGKTFCFVYSQQSKNYLDPMGHVTVNHPRNLEALRRYEDKKDEYIKRVLKGEAISMSKTKEAIIKAFRSSRYSHLVTKKDITTALKILKDKDGNSIIPDGTPNTFINEIADRIYFENKEDLYAENLHT